LAADQHGHQLAFDQLLLGLRFSQCFAGFVENDVPMVWPVDAAPDAAKSSATSELAVMQIAS